MRHHSYLRSAVRILDLYDGKEPFTSYIKKYFSANKKFGSTDRKRISHLCYCCFRTGKMLNKISTEDKILIGLFLTSTLSNQTLNELRPEWNELSGLSLVEKTNFINSIGNSEPYSLLQIFPWKDQLSNEIDHQAYCESFLVQPDLFLRLRPGKEDKVRKKLDNAGIAYKEYTKERIALPNSSKIDSIVTLNEEAVVQDYNSQRTASFLSSIKYEKEPLKVWDCCAGSGGKSIMLSDLYPNIDLAVSDIRESILANLRTRFKIAGIKKYKSDVRDLTIPVPNSNSKYDLIVADVPCTGSGTWSRVPEQLYYFEPDKIAGFVDLQKKIVGNIVPHLKPGGHLLYITCSVFREENEVMIEHLKKNLHLELIKMEVLKGYDVKADSMFGALLQMPL